MPSSVEMANALSSREMAVARSAKAYRRGQQRFAVIMVGPGKLGPVAGLTAEVQRILEMGDCLVMLTHGVGQERSTDSPGPILLWGALVPAMGWRARYISLAAAVSRRCTAINASPICTACKQAGKASGEEKMD